MLTTRRAPDVGPFRQYRLTDFDEMFGSPGVRRPHYAPLYDRLGRIDSEEFARRCGGAGQNA
jgi:uncharacterized circularly permuted ATP-grasp superfamily protein